MKGRRLSAVVLEWVHEEDSRTLHEFVAAEVNPRLDSGFVVADLRIESPARLRVVLTPAVGRSEAALGLA